MIFHLIAYCALVGYIEVLGAHMQDGIQHETKPYGNGYITLSQNSAAEEIGIGNSASETDSKNKYKRDLKLESQNPVANEYHGSYIEMPKIGSYKIQTELKNWDDARIACAKDGAKLAVPQSELDLQALRAIWIGYVNATKSWTDFCAYVGYYFRSKDSNNEAIGAVTGYGDYGSYKLFNFDGINGRVDFDDNKRKDHCFCVGSYSEKLVLSPCAQTLPYICEKEL